ncbi:putative myb dna-binding domain-containing protein [Zalerion maritima]|uniref:Myb dna-binding domain-containing protein n=1 Tax=Zalerion maritima TaxID=339359 RepID=A0AAD5WUU4_9PEZI|nr:putative myb dna-binding domain-containing protein [Zalerion maritima]
MATIEPRLIHLLNESQSPHLSHSSLPPLHDVAYPKTQVRPLPLEPDAGRRGGDGSVPGLKLACKPPFPGLYRQQQHDEPLPLSAPASSKLVTKREDGYPTVERTNSLRMILDDDVDFYETSSSTHQPLRRLRDEHTESNEDLSSKKRHHALTGKEDFPQLPHPLKKQKSANTVHMPPIINGLHEPPPNAAIFPPISSSSFNDPEAVHMGMLREFPTRSEDNSATTSPITPLDATATAAGKVKRRAAKPRRKWSEEETKHLLLGVHKHGVGRWTDILDDQQFRFNDRTAGDLKDRFRTCCPEELRSKKDKEKYKSPTLSIAPPSEPKPLPPGLLQIESILEPEKPSPNNPESPSDSLPAGKSRKSRAHRKNMDDLAELGIHTPFKKSHRRERRPFSEKDDKEILEGFQKYGPQWTKIQRDPTFHLSNRQATDLRDRLRNKRPDLFNSTKSGQLKDAGKCGPLEPSISMPVDHSLNLSRSSTSLTSLNHSNSREDMPKWPYPQNDQPSSGPVDWGEPTHTLTAPPSMSSLNNDMGISRLLLDDSQVNNDPPKQGGINVPSASSSPASGLPLPHPPNRNDYNDRRAFG